MTRRLVSTCNLTVVYLPPVSKAVTEWEEASHLKALPCPRRDFGETDDGKNLLGGGTVNLAFC